MSDGEKPAGNPAATAPPAEQQIPKTRFDEVVGQRNRMQEELNALKQTTQTLTQVIQQGRSAPRPQPAQEHPYIKKMKEEGRTEDAAFMSSLMENNRRLTATQAAMIEDLDRNNFLNKYQHKGGPERLEKVEALVEDQRRRGNWHFSRDMAFKAIIAEEQLYRDERAPAPTPQAAPAAAKPNPVEEDDAPSQDSTTVTTTRMGAAPGEWDDKTRGQEFERLKNQEF